MASYDDASSYYGYGGGDYYSSGEYYSYGYYKQPDNYITGPGQTVFYAQTVGNMYYIGYAHESYYGTIYQRLSSFDNQSGQYAIYSSYLGSPYADLSYGSSASYKHYANDYSYYKSSAHYVEFANLGYHYVSVHYTHDSVPSGGSMIYEAVSYSYNAQHSVYIIHDFSLTYAYASGYAYYTSGSSNTYLGPNGP